MSNIQFYTPSKLTKEEVRDVIENGNKRSADEWFRLLVASTPKLIKKKEEEEKKYVYIIPKNVFDACRKQIEFFTSLGAENQSSMEPTSAGTISMVFYFKDKELSMTKEQLHILASSSIDSVTGIMLSGYIDKPGFELKYSYMDCISRYNRETLERVEF